MREPFWSDDFDMDLLAVFPEAEALLAPVGGLLLRTRSSLTHGRINCPDAWNTRHGLASYFSLAERGPDDNPSWPAPLHHHSTHLVAVCTGLEVIRDLWVHQHVMMVDGTLLWKAASLRSDFDRLMGQRRRYGWLSDEAVALTRTAVLGSVAKVAYKLLSLARPGWDRDRGPAGVSDEARGKGY